MERKRIKVTDKSRKDFEFFTETKLDMIGHEVGINNPSDPEGYSALECWFQQDTHGELLPCREIELLTKAQRGKQSWNLQIKLWAEDVADGMLLRQPELVDYCNGLPGWIFEATINQAGRISERNLGWTPRFARLERVHGQWWPPDWFMDSFDPVI